MNYAHPLPGETFTFSKYLATHITLEASVVFNFIAEEMRTTGMVKDRRKWVYITENQWAEGMPFLSTSKRKQACTQLVKSGLVVKATFLLTDEKRIFYSVCPTKFAEWSHKVAEDFYESLLGVTSVNVIQSPSEPPTSPKALTMAKKFQTAIFEKFPDHQSAKTVDLLAWANRLEAYQVASTVSWDRIKEVIDYALSDPFWEGKILSPLQLVRHFMVMESQVLDKKKKEVPLEVDTQGNTLNDKAIAKYQFEEVARDHRLAEYHKTQNKRD